MRAPIVYKYIQKHKHENQPVRTRQEALLTSVSIESREQSVRT